MAGRQSRLSMRLKLERGHVAHRKLMDWPFGILVRQRLFQMFYDRQVWSEKCADAAAASPKSSQWRVRERERAAMRCGSNTWGARAQWYKLKGAYSFTQSSVVVVLWGGGDRTTSLVTIIIISIYQTTGFRITHKFLRKAKTTLKLAERQNANGKRKKKMRARQRRRERRPKLEIQ